MTYFNSVSTISDLQERIKRFHSKDVAKVSGVNRNTVRAIRNGLRPNPTFGTVQKLYDALDSMEGVEHE